MFPALYLLQIYKMFMVEFLFLKPWEEIKANLRNSEF